MPHFQLIGQELRGVHKEGDTLVLETPPGKDEFVLTPYNECRSTTWIESIDLVSPLQDGAIITKVENIPMPYRGDVGTINCPVVDRVGYYGLRITTTKGVSVIDYRNSSNGSYGGEIEVTNRKKGVMS